MHRPTEYPYPFSETRCGPRRERKQTPRHCDDARSFPKIRTLRETEPHTSQFLSKYMTVRLVRFFFLVFSNSLLASRLIFLWRNAPGMPIGIAPVISPLFPFSVDRESFFCAYTPGLPDREETIGQMHLLKMCRLLSTNFICSYFKTPFLHSVENNKTL